MLDHMNTWDDLCDELDSKEDKRRAYTLRRWVSEAGKTVNMASNDGYAKSVPGKLTIH